MILNVNSLITLEISLGITATDTTTMDNAFSSYFTTEMTPLLAGATSVRRLIGAFVTEISDDILNQLIHQNSFIAQDLANCPIDKTWERFAGHWVALVTALTVLYNTEEFRGASSDKVFKQLGDFSVSKGGAGSSSGAIGDLIDHLECEAFKYEIAVRNCTVPAMNCQGLKDHTAIPYVPVPAEITVKSADHVDALTSGRRWVTELPGTPQGNNRLFAWGRKWGTNFGGRWHR